MIKNLKTIEITAKIAIALCFVVFLYWQIFHQRNSAELWAAYQKQIQNSNPLWLAITVFLMPMNWLLEALKWRKLAQAFENYSVWYAFRAVLAGITIGVFTPNRIGEYGGRLLFTTKDKTVETIISTLLGSFSQILATLFFGLLGFYVFLTTFFQHLQSYFNLLAIPCFLGFSILIFFFYKTDFLLTILKKIYYYAEKRISNDFLEIKIVEKTLTLVKNWLKHVKFLQNYSYWQLSMALLMASLRYSVYTLQYYCMLQFMGIDLSIWLSTACITTIFLLQTSLPLPPVTGLFARGGTAVWVWSFSTANEIAILTTTFSLWLLNVILPALIGLFFILKKNYFPNE